MHHKEHACQAELLYLEKVYLKAEGNARRFSWETHILEGLITCNLALGEMLKEML